jgi:hypothetical protein
VQLQLIDFDRGTSILNSPFAIYADPPADGIGRLYQVWVARVGGDVRELRPWHYMFEGDRG